MPDLKHWRILDLQGLTPEAEQARERLRKHLDDLEMAAKTFEAKMARAAAKAQAEG